MNLTICKACGKLPLMEKKRTGNSRTPWGYRWSCTCGRGAKYPKGSMHGAYKIWNDINVKVKV